MTNHPKIEEMVGKTFSVVRQVDDDTIEFADDNGAGYRFFHDQDCCESVTVESVVGDLGDLVGEPLLVAEEVSNEQDDTLPTAALHQYEESFTWTFYRFQTIKGAVTIRWYGASNGYYSEGVSMVRLP